MARKSSAKVTPPEPGMPVVVLHGPETFLIEEYTRRLYAGLQQLPGRSSSSSSMGPPAACPGCSTSCEATA